jgi:hypothetical protein
MTERDPEALNPEVDDLYPEAVDPERSDAPGLSTMHDDMLGSHPDDPGYASEAEAVRGQGLGEDGSAGVLVDEEGEAR